MAYQKKCYRSWVKANGASTCNHQGRGGASGKAVDSGFGAPGNRRKTKKNYKILGPNN